MVFIAFLFSLTNVKAELLLESSNGVQYDAAIADAFVVNKSGEVLVGIYLKDESGLSKDSERNAWFSVRTDDVLVNLTEEDFRMFRKSSDGFNGYITKQGFDKLINDSRIDAIYIGIVGSVSDGSFVKNETSDKSQSNETVAEENESNYSSLVSRIIIVLGILVVVVIFFLISKKKRAYNA